MDLYKLKTESPDKFMYDTVNMDGEPTKKFVPTVLVVDSWTQLRSKALDIKDEEYNFEEEELSEDEKKELLFTLVEESEEGVVDPEEGF